MAAKEVDPDYRFGERVIFDLKGQRVTGRIVYAFHSADTILFGPGKVCLHVRDDGGNCWHRTEAEVHKVKP